MSETRLDPGWLARELEEIPVSVALTRDPGEGLGRDDPLNESQARALRDRLCERYHAWTGRDLASDLMAASDYGEGAFTLTLDDKSIAMRKALDRLAASPIQNEKEKEG